jgi:hypothetical protein
MADKLPMRSRNGDAGMEATILDPKMSAMFAPILARGLARKTAATP